jgi:hypothetical protein
MQRSATSSIQSVQVFGRKVRNTHNYVRIHESVENVCNKWAMLYYALWRWCAECNINLTINNC